MLVKINDIDVVIITFLLLFGLISTAQFDAVEIRHVTHTGAAKLSQTAIVPSPNRPSILMLMTDRDMAALKDDREIRTISKHWFSAIGVGVAEIAIPQNRSAPELIRRLTGKFPSSIVALNDTVVPLGKHSLATNAPESRHRAGSICTSTERIGVIDGSVISDHPRFNGHSIRRKSFVADGAARSQSSHSTGVVSVLIDTYSQGSSQELDILVGEILEQRDGGIAGSLLSVVKALDWLVSEGATVVNMSFQTKENKVFSRILDTVADNGIIMVAAAGSQRSATEMNFPAAHSKVIAVTAIDSAQNAAPYASRGEFIDFAAPGVDVPIATLQGTGRGSGTSYAAPYVTSIVALSLERGALRDVDTMRTLIAGNAIDLGVPGKDDIFGWGLPNVAKHCNRQQFSRR